MTNAAACCTTSSTACATSWAWCSPGPSSAPEPSCSAAAVYLVLTAYGAVIDLDSAANFVPLNIADNFLHLFLGASMISLGVVLGEKAVRTAAGH